MLIELIVGASRDREAEIAADGTALRKSCAAELASNVRSQNVRTDADTDVAQSPAEADDASRDADSTSAATLACLPESRSQIMLLSPQALSKSAPATNSEICAVC